MANCEICKDQAENPHTISLDTYDYKVCDLCYQAVCDFVHDKAVTDEVKIRELCPSCIQIGITSYICPESHELPVGYMP